MQESRNQNKLQKFGPKIVVIGIGGGGLNAVNNMVLSKMEGVRFITANTDCQSLERSLADYRIQLGKECTKGLGAGAKPEIGKSAALESEDEIREQLKDSDMVFIAAGMGGGTGTGASPVIAKLAKDMGILTIGVITKPFKFEGPKRKLIADQGIESLEPLVDTLIVVSNQNLLRLANENTGFADSFKIADDVLHNAVRCIVELLTKPGFINRDFADLRTVMSSMGRAMIGYGEGKGENRVQIASESAMSNPILENGSISGATSVLIIITGGTDMTLFEVQDIVEKITSNLSEDAEVLFGTTFEEDSHGIIKVSIVATGLSNNENKIEKKEIIEEKPLDLQKDIQNKLKISRLHLEDPTKNPVFYKDSFDESDIQETEVFESFNIDRDSYLKNAMADITYGLGFTSSLDKSTELDKKKKKNFGLNNEKSTLMNTTMPLFNSVFGKIGDFTKNIIMEKRETDNHEKPKISEWSESSEKDKEIFDFEEENISSIKKIV